MYVLSLAYICDVMKLNGLFVGNIGNEKLPNIVIISKYDCFQQSLAGYVESACGLVEQCRTPEHLTVSLSPAGANVFLSLGKILSLNCFVTLSVIR